MANMVAVKPDSSALYHHNNNNIYTIASLDFGELVPVRKLELVPRHRLKEVEGKGFLRLAPTIFPAYGRCSFNSAGFFVSESQILEGAHAFHDGQLYYKGKSFNLPYIPFKEVLEMFKYYQTTAPGTDTYLDNADHLCYLVKYSDYPSQGWFDSYTGGPTQDYSPINEDEFDFMAPVSYSDNVSLYGFYKLTRFGCRFYKILKACGFDWPSFGNVVTTSSTYGSVDSLYNAFCPEKFNLMPFLAYCHIYADYFLNPQFYHNSEFVMRLHKIHDMEDMVDGSTNLYIGTTGLTHFYILHFFLKNIRVPHHKGMYLNAWNTPNSPIGVDPIRDTFLPAGDEFSISPIIPNVHNSYIERLGISSSGVYLSNVNSSGTTSNMRIITQYGQRFLQNVYDFCRRNGLFGSKYWEQFWAQFGIKPADNRISHATKLFDSTQDIDFSAVMSNADTAGKTLGSYAGFGIGSLNFKFNYKSDDYGYCFVVSWLQQIPIQLHGIEPCALRRNFLDYWTPKWDGVTLRAIPMFEVSRAKRSDLSPNNNGDNKIFGFCNAYDEYRTHRDVVLGDFVTSEVARNFLFCRNLGYYRDKGTQKLVPQSNDVQYIKSSVYQADLSDPFQMAASNGDRFYLQFTFNIKEDSPIKNGAGSLDLPDGDQMMQLGGTQLS